QLPVQEQLREGRPVGVSRQVGADLRLLQHVDGVEVLGAGGLQRLHGLGRVPAHRERRGAFHEQDDRPALDLGLDAIHHRHCESPDDGTCTAGGHTEVAIVIPARPPAAAPRGLPPCRSSCAISPTHGPRWSRMSPRPRWTPTGPSTRTAWTPSTGCCRAPGWTGLTCPASSAAPRAAWPKPRPSHGTTPFSG